MRPVGRLGMIAGVVRIATVAAAAFAIPALAARAAQTFYVDPEKGSMQNDGSAAAPWRTLAEVVAGKLGRISGGDTILLRSGYHGEVQLSGAYNEDMVTVAAQEGHIPKLGRLRLNQCGKWIFKGLEISPSLAPAFRRGTVVSLGTRRGERPSHELTVENCFIYTVFDASEWSAEEWSSWNKAGKSCSGIDLEINSTKLVARNNYVLNVTTGVNAAAPGSLVEGNVVRNFSIDGMRVMSDGIVAQYNVIKNNMNVDDNHDDGIQAFLYNRGTGTLRNITTRANIIINRDDDSLPHQGPMQGIGYFDGPLIDFVIERNVVLVDHWHGVSLFEGQNGRVLENVAYSRWKTRRKPWVMLGTKKGLARDNVVKDNYAHSFKLDSFASEAANNRNVSAAIFESRLRALEGEINSKFGRYHVVSGFARVTNDRAKTVPVRLARRDSTPGGRRPSAPHREPPARMKPRPGAIEHWGAKLLSRTREELAAGRGVAFSVTAFQQRFDLLAVDGSGTLKPTLKLKSPVTDVDLEWARLDLEDRRNLALALVREDQADDHCVAAFYLTATGNEQEARDHLDKGGDGAAAVLASFEMSTGEPAAPAEPTKAVPRRPSAEEKRPRAPESDAASPSGQRSRADEAASRLYGEAETAFIDGDVDGAKALFEKVLREYPESGSAARAKEYLEILE